MLKRFLFPSKPDGTFISVILLTVRVVFGILMMNHGIDKWANYQELSAVFPDLSVSVVPFLSAWLFLVSWRVQWRLLSVSYTDWP